MPQRLGRPAADDERDDDHGEEGDPHLAFIGRDGGVALPRSRQTSAEVPARNAGQVVHDLDPSPQAGAPIWTTSRGSNRRGVRSAGRYGFVQYRPKSVKNRVFQQPVDHGIATIEQPHARLDRYPAVAEDEAGVVAAALDYVIPFVGELLGRDEVETVVLVPRRIVLLGSRQLMQQAQAGEARLLLDLAHERRLELLPGIEAPGRHLNTRTRLRRDLEDEQLAALRRVAGDVGHHPLPFELGEEIAASSPDDELAVERRPVAPHLVATEKPLVLGRPVRHRLEEVRALVDAELAKDPNLEARLLEHLPHPGVVRRLALLDPATRHDRLVSRLADDVEQQQLPLERGRAGDVDDDAGAVSQAPRCARIFALCSRFSAW